MYDSRGPSCVVIHGMTHGCQVEQGPGHSSIALLLHVWHSTMQ